MAAAVAGCAPNETSPPVAPIAPVTPTAASAPVADQRDIRCYFHADLTTTHKLKPPQEGTMPPYMTTGIMDASPSSATKDPNTGHMVTGMKQVSDPVNLCSRIWSEGRMNPDGITDDLIPADFSSPAAGSLVGGSIYKDQNGKTLVADPKVTGSFAHFIPRLTECVVDDTVAVIPGGPEVCTQLGVPSLQK